MLRRYAPLQLHRPELTLTSIAITPMSIHGYHLYCNCTLPKCGSFAIHTPQ